MYMEIWIHFSRIVHPSSRRCATSVSLSISFSTIPHRRTSSSSSSLVSFHLVLVLIHIFSLSQLVLLLVVLGCWPSLLCPLPNRTITEKCTSRQCWWCCSVGGDLRVRDTFDGRRSSWSWTANFQKADAIQLKLYAVQLRIRSIHQVNCQDHSWARFLHNLRDWGWGNFSCIRSPKITLCKISNRTKGRRRRRRKELER